MSARQIVAAILAAMPLITGAQSFPSKPVTIVVPFSPGGPSDANVRQFALAYGRQLGQTVVVENVAGGGGHIGPARVAKAAPDGYTLMQHNLGLATAPALYRNIEYNPLSDFDSIGTIVYDSSMLLARSGFPARPFKEFLEYVRANQAKIQFGDGTGPSQLSALLFMQHTGTKMQLIPYKGGGPAFSDLVAGHIDLLSNSASISGPMVKAGKVQAIGLTARRRVSNMPDVPTLDELGLTGFEMVVWTSLFGPRNLPGSVKDRLVSALQASLQDAELLAYFQRNGSIVADRDQATPAALQALVKSEVEKWGSVLRRAGIEPQ
jgi:tripartite-type tricarboxylate transporter receptor subunit TctC